MRLIDADAYIEEALSRIDPQDMYLPIHIKEMILDKMPTVDAVPVIRCKDCMYYSPDPWGYGLCECKDYRRVNEKDFCSWGERKEE